MVQSATRVSMASSPQSVTQLLNAWGAGDDAAGRELIEIVYQELRRLAGHYMQMERPDHTLQPTALVHELFLKLFSTQPIEWRDRGHFLAVAARQLRHIVVDYARVQKAKKRGGAHPKIALDDAPHCAVAIDESVLELDQALGRLSELDPRAAQVVELRYFGGLSDLEIGETLGASVATVKRDWNFAKAWLSNELK
jgi:RNA polymerase sigma-70 factor, ECF subfamily